MKFTIAIPTRNRAKLLPCALKSALNQDYDDYEIVVSNNSSEDDTEEVISQFMEDRIRYIKTDYPMSMVDHWNFLLDKVSGEWVYYLCDDDALASFTLSYMDRIIQQYPQIAIFRMATMLYFYPDVGVDKANTLIIPRIVNRQTDIIDSQDFLSETYRYIDGALPNVENSFINRGLQDEIRQKYGKAFFDWAPDISNSLLMLANTSHYAYVYKPMRVAGRALASFGFGSLISPQRLRELLNEADDWKGHFLFSPYPELLTVYNVAYDTYCIVRDLLGGEASGLKIDPYIYRWLLLRDIRAYINSGFYEYKRYYDIVTDDIKEYPRIAESLKNIKESFKRYRSYSLVALRHITKISTRHTIKGSDSNPRFSNIYEAAMYLNEHYNT